MLAQKICENRYMQFNFVLAIFEYAFTYICQKVMVCHRVE